MSLCRSHVLRFTILVLATAFFMTGIAAVYAEAPSLQTTNALPVSFTAKTLIHDDQNQTVTATGDVELDQGARILHADKIVYYLKQDKVTALGNVSLLDERGDVHFAEYVELSDNMKEGFIQGLLSMLADGSRFTATEARRTDGGRRTTLVDATYTLCHVCETDPHPLWQIKASQIVRDSDTRTIQYKNARLEFMGVPVAYSPVFSHPDPTLKRKSGFLRPQYGWSSALGAHLKLGYYYTIAPDKDFTLNAEPTMLGGTLLGGEWRERFANGLLKIDGTTVNSNRSEESGAVAKNGQRGSIFADGRFDLNDEWRTGFDLARVSDKQYLRFYDISNPTNPNAYVANPDVLDNQIYAERFSGRDYSRLSALNFQDLRLGNRPEQPDVLPMMEHDMLGAPGGLLGGRWESSVSALGLTRLNGQQNMQRGSLEAGWERRGISPFGLSSVLRFDGREDYYAVQDSDAAKLNPLLDSNPVVNHGIATASLVSSYPLVREMAKSQAVLEPIVGINLSPDLRQNQNIPNEDSIDIQFDTNNLFQENRYPGIDRQEDGGRLNYGLKTGLYEDDGRYGKVFLGQSYRIYGDTLFPQGSGLENRQSDVVGQVQVGLAKNLDVDYRFQADSRNLAIRRHEVQASGGTDDFRFGTRYLYTAPVTGTGFNAARQQIQLDGAYSLTKNWKLRGMSLVDLVGQPSLRNASAGIDYSDECFTFSVTGSRNVLDSVTGDSGTRIMVRIGLKSLGGFGGSGTPLDLIETHQ